MANYEKEPISSILVLKIVGILALISVMLALPLIWLSEAKRAVERVAREVAQEPRSGTAPISTTHRLDVTSDNPPKPPARAHARTCPACGQAFTARRADAATCSLRCRKRASRANARSAITTDKDTAKEPAP